MSAQGLHSPFELVADKVIVNVQGPGVCPSEEWDRYLRFLARHALHDIGYVCFTDGSISASQRKGLAQVVGEQRFRRAIVTSNRATVAIVTAVSWFSAGARAFFPGRVDEALAYAGVDADLAPVFWRTVRELNERLPRGERPIWLQALLDRALRSASLSAPSPW